MIQPIVEGHAEVQAVPVLLRKLAVSMGVAFVKIGSPLRCARSQLAREDGMKRAVQMARRQTDCQGILVLLDADDDCPKTEADRLLAWVKEAAAPVPGTVVMAKREYEAWLLASAENLMAARGVSQPTPYERDPEGKRDAKGELERRLGLIYSEKRDQPALTALADWSLVHQRCRSFRRMVKETRRLFISCGLAPQAWPR